MSTYTDGFTDTNGVLLQNHANSDFGGWALDTGVAPEGFTIQSNRLYLSDSDGSGQANRSTSALTLPATGFTFLFDLLGIGDYGLNTTPLTLYFELYNAAGTSGWTLQLTWYRENATDHGWTVRVYDSTLAAKILDFTSNTDAIATATLSATGPHRLGFAFGSNGVCRFFKEPVFGGTRTYLRNKLGALVQGTFSTSLLGADRKLLLNASVMSATAGWLDNATIQTASNAVAVATPRGGALAYNSPAAIEKWAAARQYALRFGLGGAGRWQRFAVVHGVTVNVTTSDVNYFALYGVEVSAIPTKQRTDTF